MSSLQVPSDREVRVLLLLPVHRERGGENPYQAIDVIQLPCANLQLGGASHPPIVMFQTAISKGEGVGFHHELALLYGHLRCRELIHL